MDYKETVMTLEEIQTVLFLACEKDKEVVGGLAIAEAQVEITGPIAYKAGYDEGSRWLSASEVERLEQSYKAGGKQARWEVGEELCCLIGNLMLEDMEAGKLLGSQLKDYMNHYLKGNLNASNVAT